MTKPIKLRFVAIELSTGYCDGDNAIISRQVYDTTVNTLVQARDEMIKAARKEHMEDRKDMGENYHSAYDCIHKWDFKTNDFTGYHHYEDGLTFLFPSYSPVYKPVVEKLISDDELHRQLLALYDYWEEHAWIHKKARKLA